MVAILNFQIFRKNCKTQKCLYLENVLDRVISTKCLTRRVSLQSSNPNFQKIFEFFVKIAKHKNAYISKTVLDRAISTKILNHRVSLQSSNSNFQKNFVSPKMATILNFSQKLQNTKMLISRKPC